MDWTQTGYQYLVEVHVVSQTNVDDTLGILDGVVLSNLSITENYYSDSRVQAKVKTVVKEGASDGYIANARLRIVLILPDYGWSSELITGYVSDINENHQNGNVSKDYTIEGTIWGLLEHKLKDPVTIGKGAKMVDVWVGLMQTQTRMQYSAEKAKDHAFGTAVIYEPASVLSTVLFEISSGYSRMDVNGHGVVLLEAYTEPSQRTPEKIIDFRAVKGLVELPLEKTSEEWEAPGRAIVTATISKTDSDGKTTQQVISGTYDAPSTHKTSINVRGWLRARSDTYSGGGDDPTVSELRAMAEKNWKNNQSEGIVWTATSVFADYHAGDIATLITPGSYSGEAVEEHKVLLQSVSTNFEKMTQELTMKEV